MRLRQPVQLNVRSVLRAAFDARDTAPDLFALWLAQAYTDDDWHQPAPEGEPYRHHASTLSNCLRQQVLDRAGSPREEWSVESLATFEIGKHFHVLIQFGLAVHPEYTLLAHEVGGVTRGGLAARTDAVYEYGGIRYIIDVKTESRFAPARRRQDAKAAGRTSTARPEHALQLAATAVVISALFPELTPDEGFILYWEKEGGNIDQQPSDLHLEAEVVRALTVREHRWVEYLNADALPPRLPDFPKGLCQPRSETDARGRYCPHRIACLQGDTP